MISKKLVTLKNDVPVKDKIEKNITGLGYYFYAKRGFDQSQSGNAIQLDKKFQSGRFKRKSYFTGIIKKVFGRITFA